MRGTKWLWGSLVTISPGRSESGNSGNKTNSATVETSVTEVGPSSGVPVLEEARPEIPPGTSRKPVTIRMSIVEDAPGGNIGNAFDFQPDGLQFEILSKLRIGYSANDLSGDERENDLLVAIWCECYLGHHICFRNA